MRKNGAMHGKWNSLLMRHVGILGLAALAGLLMACTGSASGDRGAGDREGVKIADARARPSFVLRDTSGKTFDFRKETDGDLTLIYFGYTNCPDVCPIHFANIAGALKQVPGP